MNRHEAAANARAHQDPADVRDALRRALAARWEGHIEACLEDYRFIRGDHMTARAAAERLGVTVRTVQRWRRILRDQQRLIPAALSWDGQPSYADRREDLEEWAS